MPRPAVAASECARCTSSVSRPDETPPLSAWHSRISCWLLATAAVRTRFGSATDKDEEEDDEEDDEEEDDEASRRNRSTASLRTASMHAASMPWKRGSE